MKGVITLKDRPGVRWGNALFLYAFARGYAEANNCELQVPPWIGSEVFQLNDPPVTARGLPERTEFTLRPGETNITLSCFAQSQRALDYYTRHQVKQWFTFRPEILSALETVPIFEVCAHIRHGDFLLYPAFLPISEVSYLRAHDQFGIKGLMHIVSQEFPARCPALAAVHFRHPNPDGGPGKWLADFWTLMQARVLFRANSSFSWWAAALASDMQRVFSPVLDNVRPARIVQCDFVEGNHPKIAAFPHCTDLNLAP